jgi:hypothetical protein
MRRTDEEGVEGLAGVKVAEARRQPYEGAELVDAHSRATSRIALLQNRIPAAVNVRSIAANTDIRASLPLFDGFHRR